MLEIELDIESFSINKAKMRVGSYTPEARKYRARFFHQLARYKHEILEFNKTRYREYHVQYTFYMPDLYTKKGAVSHNSGDLSNLEKLPQDFLFDPKYYGTAWLKKMSFIERKLYTLTSIINLNIDDCFITSLHSRKVPGPEYKMQIRICGM
jgi:hypothetical protein